MARFSNAEQAHSNARSNARAKDRDPWVVFTDTSGAWCSERYNPSAPCHTGHDVTVYRRTYDKCDRSILAKTWSGERDGWTVRKEYMGKGTDSERVWEEYHHNGTPAYEIRAGGGDHGVYKIGVRAVSHAQAVQLADVSERYPIPEPGLSK